jgi:hypothetical protein
MGWRGLVRGWAGKGFGLSAGKFSSFLFSVFHFSLFKFNSNSYLVFNFILSFICTIKRHQHECNFIYLLSYLSNKYDLYTHKIVI